MLAGEELNRTRSIRGRWSHFYYHEHCGSRAGSNLHYCILILLSHGNCHDVLSTVHTPVVLLKLVQNHPLRGGCGGMLIDDMIYMMI